MRLLKNNGNGLLLYFGVLARWQARNAPALFCLIFLFLLRNLFSEKIYCHLRVKVTTLLARFCNVFLGFPG